MRADLATQCTNVRDGLRDFRLVEGFKVHGNSKSGKRRQYRQDGKHFDERKTTTIPFPPMINK
jgi:hypothetical protein